MSEVSLASRFFSRLLKNASLRRRMAFHLRQYHFDDLQLRVPIGAGLLAPIGAEDNLMSFGEIFGDGEYDGLWSEIPTPRRWLDIGAHAGYFSLSVAKRLLSEGVQDWSALLIEPDPRLGRTIERGLAQPLLRRRAKYCQAAVGEGTGALSFALRGGMVSSADIAAGDAAEMVSVPLIDAAEIEARSPGPYDLVKLDVEGAEYAFVRHYAGICRAARALVVEWHAPAVQSPMVAELRERLAACGLVRVRALRLPHCASEPSAMAASGLELFTR